MKVGDNVWVKTGRDRERGGEVAKIILPKYENEEPMYGVKLSGAGIVYAYAGDLRSMSTSPTTSNTAVKLDQDKNRLDLVPVEAIEQIGLAFTFGAKKYADNNWRKGFKWTRLGGSLLRHTYAWMRGEDCDPESGLSHLAHAGACIAMLLTHEQLNYGEDDRVKSNN